MAVEHLDYQGEKIPVKLGYYTLKRLQEEHGISMESAQDNFAVYEPMLFYALTQGYRVEKKEMPFTMEDMADILDDCMFDFIALIPKFFPMDEDLLEKVLAGAGKKMGITPKAPGKRTSGKSQGKQ